MERIICPHCRSRRLAAARVPKDVVVVMPCPSCSELVVLFRRKALALDREILENGTHQERKMHIAGIIAEFLEPGLLKFALSQPPMDNDDDDQDDDALFDNAEEDEEDPGAPPITEKDVRDFARVHLRRIDNPDYFKRHLG